MLPPGGQTDKIERAIRTRYKMEGGDMLPVSRSTVLNHSAVR